MLTVLEPELDFLSFRGSSSVGRASASQAEGRRFEPGLPLYARQGPIERLRSVGSVRVGSEAPEMKQTFDIEGGTRQKKI